MLTPEHEHEMRVFAEEMPDEYGPMFGRDVVNVLKELDALRAKVAALEEAGDGLAGAWTAVVPQGPHLSDDDVGTLPTALARWREVRKGK